MLVATTANPARCRERGGMGLVVRATKRGGIAGAGWYITFLLLFFFSDFLVFYLSREFEILFSLHCR